MRKRQNKKQEKKKLNYKKENWESIWTNCNRKNMVRQWKYGMHLHVPNIPDSFRPMNWTHSEQTKKYIADR